MNGTVGHRGGGDDEGQQEKRDNHHFEGDELALSEIVSQRSMQMHYFKLRFWISRKNMASKSAYRLGDEKKVEVKSWLWRAS